MEVGISVKVKNTGIVPLPEAFNTRVEELENEDFDVTLLDLEEIQVELEDLLGEDENINLGQIFITIELGKIPEGSTEFPVKELSGLTLEELQELAEAENDADEPEALAAYFNNIGDIENFEEDYNGKYDSEAAFCESICDEIGDLRNVPAYVSNHINWQEVWDCELRFDYWSAQGSNGDYFIFRNN